jgi:hypothetical protein
MEYFVKECFLIRVVNIFGFVREWMMKYIVEVIISGIGDYFGGVNGVNIFGYVWFGIFEVVVFDEIIVAGGEINV